MVVEKGNAHRVKEMLARVGEKMLIWLLLFFFRFAQQDQIMSNMFQTSFAPELRIGP